MSAFDDYLQLLNNNPKMDTTKQWANKLGNNVKTGIENSLPPTDPSKMIDYAAGINPIAGLAGNILAWHASPHKFSKFEDKAIGTGEGMQAFGMGHYAGENVNALDSQYRRYLSEMRNNDPIEQFISDPNHQSALDKMRSHIKNSIAPTYPNYDSFNDVQKKFTELKIYNDTIKSIFNKGQFGRGVDLKEGVTKWPGWSGATEGSELYDMARLYDPPPKSQGYLYQLNLKPDKKDLLQYDTAIPHHGTDFLDKYVAGMNDLGLGQDAFTAIKSNLKGKDAYRKLTKVTGSDTETSRLLNDWGIPGHSFAGQGGQGLDNYVMYNPNDIQIIRRIKSGLDSPSESFRGYPVDVHRAVNDFKLNSADAQPRTLLQKLKELSNKNLRDIEW
jgi:hypothetical protein